MSSSTVFAPLERTRYFKHLDGHAFTKAMNDEIPLRWDLTDYLSRYASVPTVSSAAWVDHGITSSSKSVSTPVVIGTVTGLGYTVITATLSNGDTVEATFYFLDSSGNQSRYSDYGG